MLRLTNDDELNFKFTFIIRQQQLAHANVPASGVASPPTAVDTVINSLTHAHASTNRDLDNLVTREFNANPNLHKNSNVKLIGNYATEGSPSIQFDWHWKWQPPSSTERGGGYRNICSFLEYDQRAHRLNTLASFTFWVQPARPPSSQHLQAPSSEFTIPQRLRVPSAQSVVSSRSDADGPFIDQDLPSPEDFPVPEHVQSISQNSIDTITKVDVNCPKPGDDMSSVEDGPLFRATMKALEQKTGNMRTKMKKVLKKAEAAQQAQVECNDAIAAFMTALKDASMTNANAIQPALDNYFERIARQILVYEKQNTIHLQKIIIEPLARLYNFDIKKADEKKKEFDEESRDYYAYLSRYLGQRQDSLKEKKRAESDNKYQTKRRNFELKRFDYSSFMQDLHGGRKEQEFLSCLTKYAETQSKSYLDTAKKIEEMQPQLDALIREVGEADKGFQLQRTEREEKRRNLEKSTQYREPETKEANPTVITNMPSTVPATQVPNSATTANGYVSDSDLSRADSTSSQLRGIGGGPSYFPNGNLVAPMTGTMATSPGSFERSPGSNKYKGIRDLEEKDPNLLVSDTVAGQHRKEGLLWALSRPGSHIDPKGINKQAWHK